MDEQPDPAAPAPTLATQLFDKLASLGAKATPKAMADAWIEICGISDDPAMRAVAQALATAPANNELEIIPMGDAAAHGAELAGRFDVAVADAADRRADLIELHRRALGRDNAKTRTDGAPGKDGKPAQVPKTDAAIKREIIEKVDASRLRKVDRYTDAAEQRIALDQQLEECREKMDADAAAFPRLLEQIEQTRKDKASPTELAPEERAMADAVLATQASAARVFGHTPNQAPASR